MKKGIALAVALIIAFAFVTMISVSANEQQPYSLSTRDEATWDMASWDMATLDCAIATDCDANYIRKEIPDGENSLFNAVLATLTLASATTVIVLKNKKKL